MRRAILIRSAQFAKLPAAGKFQAISAAALFIVSGVGAVRIR